MPILYANIVFQCCMPILFSGSLFESVEVTLFGLVFVEPAKVWDGMMVESHIKILFSIETDKDPDCCRICFSLSFLPKYLGDWC